MLSFDFCWNRYRDWSTFIVTSSVSSPNIFYYAGRFYILPHRVFLFEIWLKAVRLCWYFWSMLGELQGFMCLSHTVLDQTRYKNTLWEATSLHQDQGFSFGLNRCQTLPVLCRDTEVAYRLNVRGSALSRAGMTSRGPFLLCNSINSHNWWQYAIRNQKWHLSRSSCSEFTIILLMLVQNFR